MLGHINIPMHMVDVHILFCRVGNPSLVAALIIFPSPVVFSSEVIGSTRATRCMVWSGVTCCANGRSCEYKVRVAGSSVPTLSLQLQLLGRELLHGHRAEPSSAVHLFSLDKNYFQLCMWLFTQFVLCFFCFSISALKIFC